MKDADPDWAPTQHMGHTGVKIDSPEQLSSRMERNCRLIRRRFLTTTELQAALSDEGEATDTEADSENLSDVDKRYIQMVITLV